MSDFEILFNAMFVYPNLNTSMENYKKKQTDLRQELLNPTVQPFLHHADFHVSTVPDEDLVPEEEDTHVE